MTVSTGLNADSNIYTKQNVDITNSFEKHNIGKDPLSLKENPIHMSPIMLAKGDIIIDNLRNTTCKYLMHCNIAHEYT